MAPNKNIAYTFNDYFKTIVDIINIDKHQSKNFNNLNFKDNFHAIIKKLYFWTIYIQKISLKLFCH